MAQAAFASCSGFSGFSNSGGSADGRAFKRSGGRPVDLVHLAKQSLGDRALEIEILSLFSSQSSLYLDRLQSAKTADERKMAAHTILGSARGIGAWNVAEEAEKIELGAQKASDLTQLSAAISAAQTFISAILEQ